MPCKTKSEPDQIRTGPKKSSHFDAPYHTKAYKADVRPKGRASLKPSKVGLAILGS
jgi:hypothetical protein